MHVAVSNTLRLITFWVMLVAFVMGPVGLVGAQGISAGTSVCGVSCPCDSDLLSTSDCDETCGPVCAGDDEHAGNLQDPCPDDCPDCDCCSIVAVAGLVMWPPSGSTALPHDRVETPMRSCQLGVLSDIFHPPLTLS